MDLAFLTLADGFLQGELWLNHILSMDIEILRFFFFFHNQTLDDSFPELYPRFALIAGHHNVLWIGCCLTMFV